LLKPVKRSEKSPAIKARSVAIYWDLQSSSDMKAPSIGDNAVSLITQKIKLYSEKNHLLKASAAVRVEL